MKTTETESPHSNEVEAPRDHHTCPVWIGRLLASPLRRLVENPAKIFAPYVTRGATVVDVGSAMGFHSLDLARLVGAEGRVVCLDIQPGMLEGLSRRARRRGLDGIIEPRLCSQEDLGVSDLTGRVDLVVALNVVHETTYPKRFLGSCVDLLGSDGRVLIAEPRGHVSEADFGETTDTLKAMGLVRQDAPEIWRSLTAVFSRS